MTTTLTIRKSLSYLPRLRKVVSIIAGKLGMSTNDIQDAENAVNEVCLGSISTAEDSQEALAISLCAEGSCLIVDIDDSSTTLRSELSTDLQPESGIWEGLERAWHLADDVKVITRGESRTIRLVKRARRLESVSHPETSQTHAAEETGILV